MEMTLSLIILLNMGSQFRTTDSSKVQTVEPNPLLVPILLVT